MNIKTWLWTMSADQRILMARRVGRTEGHRFAHIYNRPHDPRAALCGAQEGQEWELDAWGAATICAPCLKAWSVLLAAPTRCAGCGMPASSDDPLIMLCAECGPAWAADMNMPLPFR